MWNKLNLINFLKAEIYLITVIFSLDKIPITYAGIGDSNFLSHPGQCPLKIPDRFTSKSPTDMVNKRPSLMAIGHRGSSYNLPEHTLAGYRLALELGADYVEPDLVSTKDQILIACHSIDLNITTDVALKFPDRYRENVVRDGKPPMTGYFAQDFTLEEIKTLRVKQRVEDTNARSRLFDWIFTIPTFSEIIDLVYEYNTLTRKDVGLEYKKVGGRGGIYAELKVPNWIMEDANISLADLFLKELREHPHAKEMFFEKDYGNSLDCATDDEYQVPPIVIQCFYSDTLKYLNSEFVKDEGGYFGGIIPPMVYLISDKRCKEPDLWQTIASLDIAGVGPDKICLLEDEMHSYAARLMPLGKEFMSMAKKYDLAVHPWTERLETEFLSDFNKFQNAEDELRYLYCELGIDGIFAENVDVAVRVGARGCDDFNLSGVQDSTNEDLSTFEGSQYHQKYLYGFIGASIGSLLTLFITTYISERKKRMYTSVPKMSPPRRSFDDDIL